jgi:transcriptional regulator with XRE-family HTH domain
LAEKAGVTANTVSRIELGADAKQSTIEAIQRALEAVGIEFINGDRPGVRLVHDPGSLPGAEPARARKPAPGPKAASARKRRS